MERERQVKKALILTILLLLIFVSSAFCEVSIGFKLHKDSGAQNYDFKSSFTSYDTSKTANDIYKNYPKGNSASELSFSDSTLDAPTIGFGTWTKSLFLFSLKFSFSRMQMVKNNVTYFGGYDVKIYMPVFFNTNPGLTQYSESCDKLDEFPNNAGCVTVSPESSSDATIIINFNDREYKKQDPPTSKVAPYSGSTFASSDPQFDNYREGWLYPIAFRFSNHSYEMEGTYTATIRVEVISNT
jgi:hypothetical protein